MEKRVLGKTGMEVSVLGFGGAEIGYASTPVETVAQLLGGALDAGLNVIDTAECYGNGEELILLKKGWILEQPIHVDQIRSGPRLLEGIDRLAIAVDPRRP